MYVTITHDDTHETQVVPTGDDKETVRYSFNPSGVAAVSEIKALTSVLQAVIRENTNATNASIMEAARQHVITASMWAVLGATKGV